MRKIRSAGKATGELSVRFDLVPDPDTRTFENPELSASWGEIEIHIGADNVTAYSDGDDISPAITWYAVPLAEWLAANWDALLHEERTPQPLSEPYASQAPWLAGGTAISDDPETDLRWYEWWLRHDLSAAREGGMVPQLLMRRWRDKIEFSWRSDRTAGIPPEVHFLCGSGGARLSLADSATVLWGFLQDFLQRMDHAAPESSPRLQALRDEVQSIAASPLRRLRRIQWLLGLDARRAGDVDPLVDLRAKTAGAVRDQAATQTIFATERIPGGIPVTASFLAADLMRSLDPVLASDDFLSLIAEVRLGGIVPNLVNVLRSIDPETKHQEPYWLNGYELAEQFSEAISLGDDVPVNIDAVYSRLGISQTAVALKSKVRGASLMSMDLQPTAFLNTSLQPRVDHVIHRFTAAHELCHLLFDRNSQHSIAMASGSWAPVHLERRANAFAAHLLMPPSAVQKRWVRDEPLPDAIRRVARQFQVSFSAMAHHLKNLDLIDEVERDTAIEASETLLGR